jgi:hypothetical protein
MTGNATFMLNRKSINRPAAVNKIATTKQMSQAGKNEPRMSTAGARPHPVSSKGTNANA